jgi:hypothetical protein
MTHAHAQADDSLAEVFNDLRSAAGVIALLRAAAANGHIEPSGLAFFEEGDILNALISASDSINRATEAVIDLIEQQEAA